MDKNRSVNVWKGWKKWAALGTAVSFAAFSAYWCLCDFKVINYTAESEKLDTPIRIAHISDLHGCVFGENQKELIEAVKKGSPDIVVFTGDMFDDKGTENGVGLLMSALAGEYPCFYVAGNHESCTGQDRLKSLVSRWGVKVLSGETETIQVNGEYITIAGVDDPREGEVAWEYQMEVVKKAAAKQSDNFSVLLSHRPERVLEYEASGFDLVLSGHAHGGQWRIPGVLNGLLAPDQGLFPKYAGGEFDLGDTRLIVSRGLKRNFIPRYFNPPELVFISIK